MLNQSTLETLQELGLKGMAAAYRAQLQDPDVQSLSFDERFGLIVDREWGERQNRRLARRLREAKLRLPAAVEDVDFTLSRGLDRGLIRTLAEGRWLREHQNLLVSGPTGVGKTFLVCALAHAAIRLGFSARYYRVPRLLGDLAIARADGTYPKVMARLAKVDLLVLDDWGLSPFTPAEARELLEVIEERHGVRSTAVASQLPIENWHVVLGDPTVADAIMDRLVHQAYKVNLRGESMRKLANRVQATGTNQADT